MRYVENSDTSSTSHPGLWIRVRVFCSDPYFKKARIQIQIPLKSKFPFYIYLPMLYKILSINILTLIGYGFFLEGKMLFGVLDGLIRTRGSDPGPLRPNPQPYGRERSRIILQIVIYLYL